METRLTLYHGSNYSFDTVDLSKSKDKRDFGRGFYTTTLREQVANDKTPRSIALYIAGIINADEAIRRLQFSQINNQVSLHTPASLFRLKITRRYQK